MRFFKTLALAALLVTPAVAADAPKPPPLHALRVTDVELQLVNFALSQIGQGCDQTDVGQQHCLAALQAKQLIADWSAQLQAAAPPPAKP